MAIRITIICILVITHLILFGQTDMQSINCYDKFQYCIKTVYKDGNRTQTLTDVNGNKIIKSEFSALSFTETKDIFKFKSKYGYGVVDIRGDTIVPPKFRSFRMVDSLIIARDGKNKSSLYNLNREKILTEKQDLIYILSAPYNCVWALKDSIWQIFDTKGKIIIPDKFSSYDKFNFSSDVADIVWKAKSVDSLYYLITLCAHEITYEVYSDIYEPPRNSSKKVFSLLPSREGEIKKFASFGYGKRFTQAKYIDICFDIECLLKYSSDIPRDKLPKMITAGAIGILPNYDLDFINDGPKLKYSKLKI